MTARIGPSSRGFLSLATSCVQRQPHTCTPFPSDPRQLCSAPECELGQDQKPGEWAPVSPSFLSDSDKLLALSSCGQQSSSALDGKLGKQISPVSELPLQRAVVSCGPCPQPRSPLAHPASGLVLPARASDHFLVCGSAFGQSLANTEALCIYGSMFGNLTSLWLPGPTRNLCPSNFTGPCGLPEPAAEAQGWDVASSC